MSNFVVPSAITSINQGTKQLFPCGEALKALIETRCGVLNDGSRKGDGIFINNPGSVVTPLRDRIIKVLITIADIFKKYPPPRGCSS